MALGTTYGNNLLKLIFNQTNFIAPTTLYMSLHTASPGTTGANEVADTNYGRANITAAMGTPSSKSVSNTSAISFPSAAAGYTVTHWGLWDASTSGTFIDGGAFTGSITLAAGDYYEIPISDFTYTST
jgi:hypothetical protein